MLVKKWGQIWMNNAEKFTWLQQKIWIGWAAEALLSNGEGFVDEHAVGCDVRNDIRYAGPIKIVGDDDDIEGAPRDWPGEAGFEIDLNKGDGRGVQLTLAG
jgi:hypothetical protein